MISKTRKAIRPSISIRAIIIVAAAGAVLAAEPASAASRSQHRSHTKASESAACQQGAASKTPKLQNDNSAVKQIFRSNSIDAWNNAFNS